MDDRPQPGSVANGTDSAQDALEGRRAELRDAVKRGLEDVEEGRVVDLEQHFDRIEAMLDELEATKPD